MDFHIGTSGWSYDHWEGIVYPPGTPPVQRLDYYVQRFQTVEVNSTFYHWPPDKTFARWRERVPEGFLMTVKAPRGLTHGRRLLEPETWLERVQSGMNQLGPARGVLLVQLPPDMEYDPQRLDYFLGQVTPWQQTAVEFRHGSWNREKVYQILEKHAAAYCVMSGARLPCVLRATAPFIYVRFHGPSETHLYADSYSDEALSWWADRFREWRAGGREVWGYFNNDAHGYAVFNAEMLRALFGA
jgi:uncharacterized protein YecE (DUF72 family)